MLTINLEYGIEKTKDDFCIIKVHKNNKTVYLGSKYNMNREINNFLEKIHGEKSERDVFLIYGFGTGNHIKALRKKYNNRIIVFEPNEQVFKYANSLEITKEDDKLDIISCEKDTLLNTISKYINEFNFKNSEIISFSNYKQVYYEESTEFFGLINQFIIGLALNVNTKRFFGKQWFCNSINIIPNLIQAIPADLYENKYKDTMAIIVSAGPSIEKNIDLIKDYNEAFVISGGRTLPMLIEKNIKTDLLVIADSGERNYKLVKDYIEQVDIPLLFSEGANLQIVQKHKAKKLFYTFSELLLKILGRRMKPIYTGGSVAHVMTSYAAMLGCNPIVFVGQDLAYTDEKIYSDLTKNKDGTYNYNEVVSDDDIYIEDINGEMVRTSLVLNNYRKKLEEIIKLYPNIKFINATEGGARIDGTISMKLKDVLKINLNKKGNKFIIKPEYNNCAMKKRAIVELNVLKQQVNDLIKSLLEELEKINSSRVEELNLYVSKIIEKIQNTPLNQYMYETIYDFFNNEKGSKNVRKVLRKFYLQLINEGNQVLNIVEDQINKLKE